jgi:hypothetical protein
MEITNFAKKHEIPMSATIKKLMQLIVVFFFNVKGYTCYK